MGVRKSYAHEEQQDLQCVPMTSDHFCFGRRIHTSDILDLRILSIFFEHPPFSPGWTLILRQLLVRHNQVVEQLHPLLLRPSFVMLMTPCSVIMHRIRSRLSQSLLEARLSHPFVLLELWLQLRILQMTQVRQWSRVNFIVVFLCIFYDLFFCSWLFSHPMLEFSQVFPFLVYCCLCIWNLHRLRHRNNFVH